MKKKQFNCFMRFAFKEQVKIIARVSKVPIATIRRMVAGSNFNIDNMLKITTAINKELAA